MNKHRIGALIAAVALTLTFAGTALADGSVNWEGNGITAGQFNNEQCDDANAPGTMLWVFTPGGNDSVTGADLIVNGVNYGPMNQDNGQWKLRIPLIAPGDIDSASVEFEGSLGSGNAVLTISHYCGEVTTTTTDEITTTTTDDTTTTTDETTTTTVTTVTTVSIDTQCIGCSTTTTSDTTTVSIDTQCVNCSTTSEETTPGGSVEELTPPSTDTIGQPTSSSSVSTGLLLVLAGILAAVLVVVPAAARNRR